MGAQHVVLDAKVGIVGLGEILRPAAFGLRGLGETEARLNQPLVDTLVAEYHGSVPFTSGFDQQLSPSTWPLRSGTPDGLDDP